MQNFRAGVSVAYINKMDSLGLNTLVYLLTAFMTFGCSTAIKMDKPGIIRDAIYEQDIVKVETVSDQEYEFKITNIDNSALYGHNVIIPFADISTLERKVTTSDRIRGVTLIAVILALIIEYPMLGLIFLVL